MMIREIPLLISVDTTQLKKQDQKKYQTECKRTSQKAQQTNQTGQEKKIFFPVNP